MKQHKQKKEYLLREVIIIQIKKKASVNFNNLYFLKYLKWFFINYYQNFL